MATGKKTVKKMLSWSDDSSDEDNDETKEIKKVVRGQRVVTSPQMLRRKVDGNRITSKYLRVSNYGIKCVWIYFLDCHTGALSAEQFVFNPEAEYRPLFASQRLPYHRGPRRICGTQNSVAGKQCHQKD